MTGHIKSVGVIAVNLEVLNDLAEDEVKQESWKYDFDLSEVDRTQHHKKDCQAQAHCVKWYETDHLKKEDARGCSLNRTEHLKKNPHRTTRIYETRQMSSP